jgi:hypothetical protein
MAHRTVGVGAFETEPPKSRENVGIELDLAVAFSQLKGPSS